MKWPKTDNWKSEMRLRDFHSDEFIPLALSSGQFLQLMVRDIQKFSQISDVHTIAEVERALTRTKKMRSEVAAVLGRKQSGR